ncbi:MAG: YbjQ family protein, partial [Methylocella sp.]
MMVSTTNDVTGFRIVRHLGIVRGVTVRSRSVVGNFVGGLQSIFGGQIGAYVELAETARQEAFDYMCAHATQ